MRLYNTRTRSIEEFEPLAPPVVTYYSCGPTVYDYTHLGHLRTFINNDFLRRSLKNAGYQVNHVMNITDVGHLTDDADSGEDKLERGAKKFGKTVEEVASFFSDYFFMSTDAVGIQRPETIAKATNHIADMIALIKQLEEKGHTYETEEALYFDTSKFEKYGSLSGQSLEDKIVQAREEVHVDSQKKHPADFVLWFKRIGRFKDHTMHWGSPWGDGFPGWHIECSAMSMKYLGNTIDIHAGGVDHITVHHENEIAQSEAATGQEFVRFWFHNEFLLIEGEKMSKSKGNFLTIDAILEKNIDTYALRYLFMQTHYRQIMNFTWNSLEAAQNALTKLRNIVQQLRFQTQRNELSSEKLAQVDEYRKKFTDAIENDLQMPQALAVLWEVTKSNIPSPDKLDLLYSFDEVLGLDLHREVKQKSPDEIPADIEDLARKRTEARNLKDFVLADLYRDQLQKKGYSIEDSSEGYVLRKI